MLLLEPLAFWDKGLLPHSSARVAVTHRAHPRSDLTGRTDRTLATAEASSEPQDFTLAPLKLLLLDRRRSDLQIAPSPFLRSKAHCFKCLVNVQIHDAGKAIKAQGRYKQRHTQKKAKATWGRTLQDLS